MLSSVNLNDLFSGEVISNLRDLQSLNIDMSADKEKQKAEVKHILQQKQRALSDLFKMLAEIGDFPTPIHRRHVVFLSQSNKIRSTNLNCLNCFLCPIKVCRTVKG